MKAFFTNPLIFLLFMSLGISGCGETNIDSGFSPGVSNDVESNKFDVLFDGNGSDSGAVPETQNAQEGSVVSLNAYNQNGMAKTGYVFSSWNTASNGSGTSYADGASFTVSAGDTMLYAQWALPTVMFDGNGSDGGAIPTSQSGTVGSSENLNAYNQNSMSRTGYTFASWNTAADGSGTTYANSASFTYPASDTTLYAQWSVNTYNITFDGNGSDGGAVPTSQSGSYASSLSLNAYNQNSMSRAGYTFASWNTAANGSGTTYANSASFTVPASNTTLYAQWTISTYTVTYNGNSNTGGAAPTDGSSPYNYNSSVTVLGNTGTLVKAGYTFNNWNTAANGSGTTYAGGATFAIVADTTLYAQWSANTYTITFNGNGSTGGAVPTSQSGTTGSSVTLNAYNQNSMSRTGYTFVSWNTAANGSGTSYANGASFAVPPSNTTLYAQWSVNTYNITFNGNGSTGGAVPTSQSGSYASSLSLNAYNQNSMSRTGYTFVSWNTAANGSGTTYANSASFTVPASNTTLYAQWSVNTYSITFNGNGSTGGAVPTTQSGGFGSSVNLNAYNQNSMSRTGYTFVSWNTAANGSGTTYSNSASFTIPSSNTTLYAQWSVNTYNITFNGNGNTAGAVPTTQSGTYGASVNLNAYNQNSMVRAGYTFIGWNTASNGSGTSYVDGASFTIPALNTTLYARWSANTYSITFDGNGSDGGAVPTSQSGTTDSYVTLNVYNQNGMSFSGNAFYGWNTAANGSGTSYADGASFTVPASNTTLYAQWGLPSVIFNGNGSDSGSVPNTQSGALGSLVNLNAWDQNSMSRAGYTFVEWNTASNGSGTAYADGAGFTLPESNTILYAQWSANTYNITFDGNGSDGGAAPTTQSGATDSSVTLNAYNENGMAKAGYSFAGWNTLSDGSGSTYADGASFTVPAGDTTLYAQWALSTVSFVGNGSDIGSAPSSQSGTTGSSVTLNAYSQNGMARTGFVFSHWNTQDDNLGLTYADGADFTFSAPNTTLYAQWGLPSVYFNGNGSDSGSVPNTQSGAVGSSVTLNSWNQNSMSRSGYTFAGWNTASNGSGTAYADQASFTLPASNITLYAQWSGNTYTVTFDGNGSDGGAAPTSQSGTAGASVTLNAYNENGMAKAGYNFAGWNTVSDGSGSTYADGASFTVPAGDVVLYAQWALPTYNITFDGNGHDGGAVPSTQSGTTGSSVTLNAYNQNGMERVGYGFTGWNTSSDGSGASYANSASFTVPESNTTLYAQWVSAYNVTYDGSGHDSGSVPSSQSGVEGSSVTLNAYNQNGMAKAGYSFTGWNTLSDGSGTAYTNAASFTFPATGTTLYAQWSASTYNVTYDGNGYDSGSVPSTQSGNMGSSVTLNAYNQNGMEKSGYSFTGWNTAPDGSGADYGDGANFTFPAGDTTLYAKWNMVVANNLANSDGDNLSSMWTPQWESLAGYWKFDETLLGMALGGGDFYDSSGKGKNGRSIASVEYGVSGRFNGSIDTGSSSNSYIDIGNINISSGNYAIATWFEYPLPRNCQPSGCTLVHGHEDHQVFVNSADMKLGALDTSNSIEFHSSGFDMSTLGHGWHYLVASAHNGQTDFYMDGVLVGSSDFASKGDITSIGNFQEGGQSFGLIDELAIWSTWLTSSEIYSIFNNQNSR